MYEKKVTEQILRNLAKGVKSPFLSPVGPMGPKTKRVAVSIGLYRPIVPLSTEPLIVAEIVALITS